MPARNPKPRNRRTAPTSPPSAPGTKAKRAPSQVANAIKTPGSIKKTSRRPKRTAVKPKEHSHSQFRRNMVYCRKGPRHRCILRLFLLSRRLMRPGPQAWRDRVIEKAVDIAIKGCDVLQLADWQYKFDDDWWPEAEPEIRRALLHRLHSGPGFLQQKALRHVTVGVFAARRLPLLRFLWANEYRVSTPDRSLRLDAAITALTRAFGHASAADALWTHNDDGSWHLKTCSVMPEAQASARAMAELGRASDLLASLRADTPGIREVLAVSPHKAPFDSWRLRQPPTSWAAEGCLDLPAATLAALPERQFRPLRWRDQGADRILAAVGVKANAWRGGVRHVLIWIPTAGGYSTAVPLRSLQLKLDAASGIQIACPVCGIRVPVLYCPPSADDFACAGCRAEAFAADPRQLTRRRCRDRQEPRTQRKTARPNAIPTSPAAVTAGGIH